MSSEHGPPDHIGMMLFSHPTEPDWIVSFEAICSHYKQLRLPMKTYPHPFLAMVKGAEASKGLCTNCALRVHSLVEQCLRFAEPQPVNRRHTKRKDAP